MTRHIGEFEILETLGGGGSNTVVYKARHVELNRTVVLKQITVGEVGKEDREVRKFLNEAKVMANISSDHVITLYTVRVIEGKHTLELEFMQGGSLFELLDRRDLDVEAAGDILTQLLKGLKAIHERELVHRDIKPGNILTDGAGRFKIADFGISLRQGERPTLLMGTAQYVAPEMLMPPHDVDQRVDLYALGMTMYEAFLGRKRFQEAFKNLLAGGPVVADHRWMNWTEDLDAAAPSLHELDPKIPKLLSDVVAGLMAKRLTERFESADAALRVLQSGVVATSTAPKTAPLPAPKTAPLPATKPPEAPQPPKPPKKKQPPKARKPGRWKLWAAVALVLVVAVGGLVAVNTILARPVDVTIETNPPGAVILLEQGPRPTPAEFEQLDPQTEYNLKLRKPGYALLEATFRPSLLHRNEVFDLEPLCADDDGSRVRTILESLDADLEAAIDTQIPIAVVIGRGCPHDAVVRNEGGLFVEDAEGNVTTAPVEFPAADQVAEVTRRLEAIRVRQILLAVGAPVEAGLELVVSKGNDNPPTPAPVMVANQDTACFFVRSGDLPHFAVFGIYPTGELALLFPRQLDQDRLPVPAGVAGDSGWAQLNQRDAEGRKRPICFNVDPPAGRDNVVAFASAEPWGGLLREIGAYSLPVVDEGQGLVVFEPGASSGVALEIAERLAERSGWARASSGYAVEVAP